MILRYIRDSDGIFHGRLMARPLEPGPEPAPVCSCAAGVEGSTLYGSPFHGLLCDARKGKEPGDVPKVDIEIQASHENLLKMIVAIREQLGADRDVEISIEKVDKL